MLDEAMEAISVYVCCYCYAQPRVYQCGGLEYVLWLFFITLCGDDRFPGLIVDLSRMFCANCGLASSATSGRLSTAMQKETNAFIHSTGCCNLIHATARLLFLFFFPFLILRKHR